MHLTFARIAAGACLAIVCNAPVYAETLQESACYLFAGREQCRTVTIVNPLDCTLKIRPQPLVDVDPEIAGCLLDDVQTRKFFPGQAKLDGAPAASTVATDSPPLQVSGRGVVQVLTHYDDNGAPVWQPQNALTLASSAEPDKARAALARLSACAQPQTPAQTIAASESAGIEGNTGTQVMSAREAFTLAGAGKIALIDIRHESEWRRTGIGVNAIPISMHQSMPDFIAQLSKAAGADKSRPLALICAEGIRSAQLQTVLKRWFPRVIDVNEGMLGSAQGEGWIAAGLPTIPYRP